MTPPFVVLLAAAISAGCASSGTQRTAAAAGLARPNGIDDSPKFDEALASFVEHDRAQSWTPETCAAVAGKFDAIGTAPASFDAGLTHERCNDAERALAGFQRALERDPTFSPARAKVALYRFRKDGDADAAIRALEQAVASGKFIDVASLVDLASLQIARDGENRGVGCTGDLACAKLNLQRALALDDAYMPAQNELALYYLAAARRRAGQKGQAGVALTRRTIAGASEQRSAGVQELELAALVCSRAISQNPRYAPIHNTYGLIQHELGRTNLAVAEFGRAVELEPRLFEAQMNLGAVNLGVRGFEPARLAYEKAVALRPNDYEAHLGLAVALRGPLQTGHADDASQRSAIAAVRAELETAKRIDPARPEAYFNEGIFLMELGTPDERALATAAFLSFIAKAKARGGYETALRKAIDHLEDLQQMTGFLRLDPTP